MWATRASRRTITAPRSDSAWRPTAGPETGTRDRASYVLEQNKIRLVLTTPLRPDHPIADHIRLHGDGVRDIALWVDDAEAAWRETTRRGARSVREPETVRDERGEVRLASIATYGDTIHTFVERENYQRRVSARFSARWRAMTWWRGRPVCSTSTTWWAMSAGAK